MWCVQRESLPWIQLITMIMNQTLCWGYCRIFGKYHYIITIRYFSHIKKIIYYIQSFCYTSAKNHINDFMWNIQFHKPIDLVHGVFLVKVSLPMFTILVLCLCAHILKSWQFSHQPALWGIQYGWGTCKASGCWVIGLLQCPNVRASVVQ